MTNGAEAPFQTADKAAGGLVFYNPGNGSWTRLQVRLGGCLARSRGPPRGQQESLGRPGAFLRQRGRLMPARRSDKARRPHRRASGRVARSPSGWASAKAPKRVLMRLLSLRKAVSCRFQDHRYTAGFAAKCEFFEVPYTWTRTAPSGKNISRATFHPPADSTTAWSSTRWRLTGAKRLSLQATGSKPLSYKKTVASSLPSVEISYSLGRPHPQNL